MCTRFFRQQAYLNGRWVDAPSGQTHDIINPATGEVIGAVPNCGSAETQAAIDAARAALPAWRSRTAYDRCVLLRRVHDLLLEHKDELGRLLTVEEGKPLQEATGEIAYSATFFDWFAEEAKRIYGETIPSRSPGKRLVVTREPVGICAAITPWNFPSAMIARKMAPALAAGCTLIVKPAPETPYSALAFGVLCEEAGIPAGVFNVVTGDAEPIADALLQSTAVRKITFTGSVEVGKLLVRRSAETLKKVTLELGGNAPFIVFADADLDQAVPGASACKYRNAGQTCVCANRFFVQSAVADEFIARLVTASRALRVGHGLKPGIEIGPLINREAKIKVNGHIRDALDKGAGLLCGGISVSQDLFMAPTVLVDVTPDMRLWNEEIFGPVCAVTVFDTEDEAIAMANDTEYGLAGYFYTRDLGRAIRVSEALECGLVGVNTGMVSSAEAPFGGVKQSGLGREGGRHGIEEYLETKYTCIEL